MTHTHYTRLCIVTLLCLFTLMPSTVAQRRGTQKTKTTQAQNQKRKATSTQSTKAAKPTKAQLQKEKAETARQRKQQQERARQLNLNIKANLDSLLILDNQMSRQTRSIDSLNSRITSLQAQIDTLQRQLERLQKQLDTRKRRYAKSLQQQRRSRSIQQRLSFIFSADNFTQMIRRMRYMQEYSTYQRAQGELIKEKQAEVTQTHNRLLTARADMQTNLTAMQRHKSALQTMKASCQSKAQFLNKNLSNVQQQIAAYQKREQALSDQIDRLIQEEIEAERRRRAAEEARRRAAEEARRKAAAEEARRMAAEQNRQKTAKNDTKSRKKSSTTSGGKTKTTATAPVESYSAENYSADTRLSNNFTANKGRLPMPVTGSYSVVGHYGTYNVQGLKGVTLNNKGIDIRAQQGASARAVFDGEVSSIFQYAGTYIVMLRHGSYISVYSGLHSVSVKKGQTVKTRDTLGSIGPDSDGHYTLHFQLRRESERLNPERWVR